MKDHNKDIHHSHHTLPHHKVSHFIKIIIWLILLLISVILIIYVLGSPKIIGPKSLDYHPLYTYFQWEFKFNNLNPKRLLRQLFSQKKSSKYQFINNSTSTKLKSQSIINIVYGNATQSYHFDNWLFLGDYVSFLVNKHNKIIQKKVMTHKFAELYIRLKSHTEIIEDYQNQQTQIDHEIEQKNQAAFFRFSDQFQRILQSEDVYVKDLGQKKIMQKTKDLIDSYLQGFHNYFKEPIQKQQIQITDESQIWILWLLHLDGQQLNELKNQLASLQRRFPKDKFIILSFHPVLQNQNRFINYQHINKKSFKKLFKTYLNSSSSHSTLMSKKYEYSLLELSNDVCDDDSFTMYNLVGGRAGYSDLSVIPLWVLEKVEKLCVGQKIKTLKIMQQQQKIHFYRMGIYKLGNDIMWKNKYAKKNYEFQVGKFCKKIPIFHNDYLSMLQTFKKAYFGSLFDL